MPYMVKNIHFTCNMVFLVMKPGFYEGFNKPPDKVTEGNNNSCNVK